MLLVAIAKHGPSHPYACSTGDRYLANDGERVEVRGEASTNWLPVRLRALDTASNWFSSVGRFTSMPTRTWSAPAVGAQGKLPPMSMRDSKSSPWGAGR